VNVPPAILHLVVARPGGRSVRLWLPLFLLWPLALALGVVTLLITIILDIVLFLLGRRYYRYTILLARMFALFGETRGMDIRINSEQETFNLTVY
jgi:H+/Cl- antiporter ClcA